MGEEKSPLLSYTITGIRIRRPGMNYQPGGPQEYYHTHRDAIVISIEKYQQNASSSFTGATCKVRLMRKNINTRIIQKNARVSYLND